MACPLSVYYFYSKLHDVAWNNGNVRQNHVKINVLDIGGVSSRQGLVLGVAAIDGELEKHRDGRFLSKLKGAFVTDILLHFYSGCP